MTFNSEVKSETFNLLRSKVTAYLAFYPKGRRHSSLEDSEAEKYAALFLNVSVDAKVEYSLSIDGVEKHVPEKEFVVPQHNSWGYVQFGRGKDTYSKICLIVK